MLFLVVCIRAHGEASDSYSIVKKPGDIPSALRAIQQEIDLSRIRAEERKTETVIEWSLREVCEFETGVPFSGEIAGGIIRRSKDVYVFASGMNEGGYYLIEEGRFTDSGEMEWEK